jgi:protein-arginine kinase activator protein McsA
MHHSKTTQILSTRFEDDLHYDMSTINKLRELEESKKEAVA